MNAQYQPTPQEIAQAWGKSMAQSQATESEISTRFTMIHSSLNALEEVIHNLDSKLDPILTPEPPVNGASGGGVQEIQVHSLTRNRLGEIQLRISAATNRINNILSRSEL